MEEQLVFIDNKINEIKNNMEIINNNNTTFFHALFTAITFALVCSYLIKKFDFEL